MLGCRILGHRGAWGRANTDGRHWFSWCSRCGGRVVRSCHGGGWATPHGLAETTDALDGPHPAS